MNQVAHLDFTAAFRWHFKYSGDFPNAPGCPGASVKNSVCTGRRSLSRRLPSGLWPSSSHALLQRALRMRSPVPSADMRSNRCVPLRGTSAGYASASSAFIWLLKSGWLRFRESDAWLGIEYVPLVHINQEPKVHNFPVGTKNPHRAGFSIRKLIAQG